MDEGKVPLLSSLAEWVRSALAMFVVVFAFLIIGYAWSLRGISDAKELAATLLGMVGIVLGYYFGSKGVSEAQDLAKQEGQEKKLIQLKTANYDAILSKLDDYQKTVSEYRQLMERVAQDKDLSHKVEELLTRIQSEASDEA